MRRTEWHLETAWELVRWQIDRETNFFSHPVSRSKINIQPTLPGAQIRYDTGISQRAKPNTSRVETGPINRYPISSSGCGAHTLDIHSRGLRFCCILVYSRVFVRSGSVFLHGWYEIEQEVRNHTIQWAPKFSAKDVTHVRICHARYLERPVSNKLPKILVFYRHIRYNLNWLTFLMLSESTSELTLLITKLVTKTIYSYNWDWNRTFNESLW